MDLHDESSDVTGQTVVYHEAQPEAAWAAQAMAGHLNEALDEADTAFRTAGGLPSGSLARAAAELFDAARAGRRDPPAAFAGGAV